MGNDPPRLEGVSVVPCISFCSWPQGTFPVQKPSTPLSKVQCCTGYNYKINQIAGFDNKIYLPPLSQAFEAKPPDLARAWGAAGMDELGALG